MSTFKHTFKVWTTEEIMSARSSAYQFLDFDEKENYTEDNELNKGC